ncbi:MFS transporter [Solirubrobacter soli]|uniref:MFS transporter n=1 Tax=Solirubrobacter soli TaxID=363832 RepID=UPI00069D03B0|nr:MFS transporter [Solirubrobacter soli]
MVFAVAMTFIDQTIVAIAIPDIQRELSLSATGSQWVINGYLLSLSALFALGGKLGDVLGRRRMVSFGVIGFAVASALAGITPSGGVAEAWIISVRVLQGAGAALLFPAAVGIVAAAFPQRERGRAMAIFFGVAGGMTAIGPIAGGYLTEWTWRSIFWINIPVAIVALALIRRAVEDTEIRRERLDYRATALITGAMALIVLGLQQSAAWGWGNAATWGALAAGALLGLAFVRRELSGANPLLRLQIFRERAFAADTAVLGLMSVVFIPFFFFASIYAQVSLGATATDAGLYVLYFFLGYVVMSQLGGRILDRRGARPAIVLGSAISALGFYLLAGRLTDLSLSDQWLFVAIAGGGIGLMLTPASTDALNRASNAAYSEVTGITQTARNFGASLGLAVLGAILVTQTDANVTRALTADGVPADVAHRVASSFGSVAAHAGGQPSALVHDVQLAFAHSTQTVFYVMAGVMTATFLLSLVWVPRVKEQEER